MPTETPTTNPGAAMSNFIQGLQQAGMDQAATEPAKETNETKALETNTPTSVKPNTGTVSGDKVGGVVHQQPVGEPKTVSKGAATEPDPDEEKWPRDAKGWEAYKTRQKERRAELAKERDAIKSERDKLNQEIATLRKSGPSPELDALKKERDELSDRLRIVAVEQHPKFRQYFDGKISEQLELAKDIVGNGKSDEIVTLLKQPDSAWRRARLEELTVEMTPMQQSQLAGVMLNLSTINRERNGAIAGAKETYEKMVADQKAAAEKQATELKSNLERLLKGAIAKVQDPATGISAFQLKDGDENWNAEVNKRLETANNMLTGTVDPAVAMDTLLMGIAAPSILSQLNTALEDNAKLQAQIKELSTAMPTLQTSGTTGSTNAGEPPAPQLKPGMNPHDLAREWTKGLNMGAGQ